MIQISPEGGASPRMLRRTSFLRTYLHIIFVSILTLSEKLTISDLEVILPP